jgi:hypothetical protein
MWNRAVNHHADDMSSYDTETYYYHENAATAISENSNSNVTRVNLLDMGTSVTPATFFDSLSTDAELRFTWQVNNLGNTLTSAHYWNGQTNTPVSHLRVTIKVGTPGSLNNLSGPNYLLAISTTPNNYYTVEAKSDGGWVTVGDVKHIDNGGVVKKLSAAGDSSSGTHFDSFTFENNQGAGYFGLHTAGSYSRRLILYRATNTEFYEIPFDQCSIELNPHNAGGVAGSDPYIRPFCM